MKYLLAFVILVHFQGFAFESESHTKASILASSEIVQKGEPFYLGIHLEMSDHWHTYWEFPGFAGLPTSWKLDEVEGLSIDSLQFPVPKVFVDDAGYISFGYDDETLLIAKAVYTGEADVIPIKGVISWLECETLCIPGSQKVSLNIKVGTSSKPLNQDIFEKYRNRIPVVFNDNALFTYSSSYQFGEEVWEATVVAKPKEDQSWDDTTTLEFFPLANDYAEFSKLETEVQGSLHTFRLTYDVLEEAPEDVLLKGVIALNRGDKVEAFRVQLHPQGSSANTGSSKEAQNSGTSDVPASYAAWYILFLAFLGGMILNLMPCVLPVLSLKVFSLLKEAGESRGRRIRFGWVYTFGIMVSFFILSIFFVSAKSAGEQLGIGFQFQSPAFVIAISALIFVMALSFLGVFQISAPTSNKLYSLTQKSGYQGAFFQGALMTILSTPCTAPFLGAAYGWALAQSSQVIVLSFLVVAFGLAFPYLILCYAPGLLKFLPKPGAWMYHFEVAMGFLLMGTVIWLIQIVTDLTGTSGSVGLLALLLFLASAAWVYGKTFYSESRVKGLFGVIMLVSLGVYVGMFKLYDIRDPFAAKQEKLTQLRLAFMSKQDKVGSEDFFKALDKQVTTEKKIAWVPYSSRNLDYFRNQNRVIFLDFTATWCATCKVNEHLVVNTDSVRKVFSKHNVVTMKADYTDKSDQLTKVIRSFDRAGVPLYVVFPGVGQPLVLPETITKSLVTEAIKKASLSVNQRSSL